VSVKEVSKLFTDRLPFENAARQKIVLYIGNQRVKISKSSSFFVFDSQVFQMSKHAIGKYDEIYVPAESFFSILKQSILPGLDYDAAKRLLSLNLIEFNINGVAIEQKSNGTILRVNTSRQFSDGDISSFVNNNGWFYLTIREGIVDTSMIKKTDIRGLVTKVTSNQFNESAQLAFRLRSDIIGHEVYQSSDPNAIVITLRTPFKKLASHIKDMKDRWRLDTVVLDAGHGGKDPSAVGYRGTKEKDIALDVAKRLEKNLAKNMKVKIVMTRDKDIFLSLSDRTKIANESNGSLFISIHTNAAEDRRASGFETFLIGQNKNEAAVRVAARENAVLELEGSTGKKLTNEDLIKATTFRSKCTLSNGSLY
jgi:N-acetylmuramoyl-L-alanine amidase